MFRVFLAAAILLLLPHANCQQATGDEPKFSLEEAAAIGKDNSQLLKRLSENVQGTSTAAPPEPDLGAFRESIGPVLRSACLDCHGEDTQEGAFRLDTLDPDLSHGADVAWWREVAAVITNGEMPPEDGPELSTEQRNAVIEWLSSEIQTASRVRREEQQHSSFRRMTRYETNYALQDLLGLPFDFTADLPPDPETEDGFKNSSEVLQMSTSQLDHYRELSRTALRRSIVRGQRPAEIYWAVSMEAEYDRYQKKQQSDKQKRREQLAETPDKLERELKQLDERNRRTAGSTRFVDLAGGESTKQQWRYSGAKYALQPAAIRPGTPSKTRVVAIVPALHSLIVELGNQVPDAGMLRIRMRASRTESDSPNMPAVCWEFGWQASNNSSAGEPVGTQDVVIAAPPGKPEFYEWEIPLSEIAVRNPLRRTATMGKTPSPSEYLRLRNSAFSQADLLVDYIEITAPVYQDWPPESHQRLLPDSVNKSDETRYAGEVLAAFMPRAWRRTITPEEVDQKLKLFSALRPSCDDFQEAIIEVLASVLSSPQFLYVGNTAESLDDADSDLIGPTQFGLASRLSLFLWSSGPDAELMQLAEAGRLSEPGVLLGQVERLLNDPRSRRFSKHFVRQWLGIQLLDYLKVDEDVYPQFDSQLKEAMQEEPIQFFENMLAANRSVIDFLHADYAIVNERLARHYGLQGVHGNHFRRVDLLDSTATVEQRGGLLAQAGLLAMNSDGKDSHPLKRGIWLLKRILNDPPPPPPPAVPEIDLADPEIARLTLKEQIENHRNNAACMSCHAKIDPWGIAFENFDAIGSWRSEISGQKVDASSLLFNSQPLDGMDGLKRFLLVNRQDQFVQAVTHKMMTYALGRPLTFSDHAELQRIATELRNKGDGLSDLVKLVVSSELFNPRATEQP